MRKLFSHWKLIVMFLTLMFLAGFLAGYNYAVITSGT